MRYNGRRLAIKRRIAYIIIQFHFGCVNLIHIWHGCDANRDEEEGEKRQIIHFFGVGIEPRNCFFYFPIHTHTSTRSIYCLIEIHVIHAKLARVCLRQFKHRIERPLHIAIIHSRYAERRNKTKKN